MNTLLIGVFVVIGVVVLYFVVSMRMASETEKKYQASFDEIQSVLQKTLIPLDFEEKRGAESRDKDGNRMSNVYFSRGKTLVHLRMDTKNALFYLAATRKLAYGDDFVIEGSAKEIDSFKTDSIKKLNEWIFKESIR